MHAYADFLAGTKAYNTSIHMQHYYSSYSNHACRLKNIYIYIYITFSVGPPDRRFRGYAGRVTGRSPLLLHSTRTGHLLVASAFTTPPLPMQTVGTNNQTVQCAVII